MHTPIVSLNFILLMFFSNRTRDTYTIISYWNERNQKHTQKHAHKVHFIRIEISCGKHSNESPNNPRKDNVGNGFDNRCHDITSLSFDNSLYHVFSGKSIGN